MFHEVSKEKNQVLVISAGHLLENMNANKVLIGFIWGAFGPVLWRLLMSCGMQYAVMFEAFSSLRDQFCQGVITPHNFRNRMSHVLGRDIAEDRFWQIWNSMLENVPHFDEISEKLQLLKSKFDHVIVVSDTNEVQVNYLKAKKGYQLLFDSAVLSYQVGKLKADLMCDVIEKLHAESDVHEFIICLGFPRGPEKERLEKAKQNFLEHLTSDIQSVSQIVYLKQPGIDHVLSVLDIKSDPVISAVSTEKLKMC